PVVCGGGAGRTPAAKRKRDSAQPQDRAQPSRDFMYQAIILATDGPIATIKLNRPDKLNAFGGPLREEILDALGKLAIDDAIRVLVVTGEGRGFSAGGDIDHLN